MTNGRIRNPFNPNGEPTPPTQRPGTGPINENPNFSNGLKPLNPQQKMFVKNYLANGFKATDAAIAAGYQKNYGANLLQLPNVQDAIRKEIARMARRIDITQEAVLQEIANVAFGNIAEFFTDFGAGRSLTIRPKEDLTEEQQRLMSSISETWRGTMRTLQFKAHDKLRALTLLSQYLGLLDGTGKQVDPEGMAQRLRAAAARAQDTLPTTPDAAPDYEDNVMDEEI